MGRAHARASRPRGRKASRNARLLWQALALSSVVIVAGAMVVSVPFAIVLIRSRNGDVTAGAQFWQTMAAGFAVLAPTP